MSDRLTREAPEKVVKETMSTCVDQGEIIEAQKVVIQQLTRQLEQQRICVSLPERIKYFVERYGGLRASAAILDIDPGYLSRMRNSVKMNPSDIVLDKLGLERRTMFVLKEDR